mmetsp:Transcript_5392/g.13042  ORF Transcript_5392/g.13042 Transcript_5392/m.13042 type:complete len:354 (+) Transcript_5392:146-1207(+)
MRPLPKQRPTVTAKVALELGRTRCETAEQILDGSFSTLHPSCGQAVSQRRTSAVQHFQKSVQVLLKPPRTGMEDDWEAALGEHFNQPPREIALCLEENQLLKDSVHELEQQLTALRQKEAEDREVRREERRAAQEQRRLLHEHADTTLKHSREREQENARQAAALQAEVKDLRRELETASQQLADTVQRENQRVRRVSELEEETQTLRDHYQRAAKQASDAMSQAQGFAEKAEQRWAQVESLEREQAKDAAQVEDLREQLRLAHLYCQRLDKSWQSHVKQLESQLRQAGLDPTVNQLAPVAHSSEVEPSLQRELLEESAAVRIQKQRRGQLGRRNVQSQRAHGSGSKIDVESF